MQWDMQCHLSCLSIEGIQAFASPNPKGAISIFAAPFHFAAAQTGIIIRIMTIVDDLPRTGIHSMQTAACRQP